MDETLTVLQVAVLLQLHPRTIYKLVKQGKIPGKKFAGGWRFSKAEIMQLVTVPMETAAKSDSTDER
jgi:excisionase family DNA binding protein